MKYPHYISEKFEYPLQNKTIPIYWGATYIEHYYPNCCIQLSGNIKSDILIDKRYITKFQEIFERCGGVPKKIICR